MRHALLLSGGIGDYLHYLTRLPADFASLSGDPPTCFVESTVPEAGGAHLCRELSRSGREVRAGDDSLDEDKSAAQSLLRLRF